MDYKPDRSFLNELKRTDKRLGCRFNGQFFVLTYERPCGGSVPIMSVRDPGGGFRQPDQRDIMKLKESDLAREDYREKFNRMGKMSEYLSEQEQSRRKRKEKFRDITRDSKIQLRNAFAKAANTSKSNAGFRQIKIKSKGKVFGKEQSP
jgi:hypothetical protein